MRPLLKIGYVLLAMLLTLATLEVAARWLGLGTPVLYYNAAWGGMRPLPGQRATRRDGARITVDQNGFRSARPEQPDALRVLFIRDSVTWGGSYIDDSELFTEVAADSLRARGQPVYAMNAGVNGTALVNHAELFPHVENAADVLVWLFPWTDVTRVYNIVTALFPARFAPRFALVEVVDYLIFSYWTEALREPRQPAEAYAPEFAARYQEFFEHVLAERQSKNLSALVDVLTEARRRNLPVFLGITPRRSGARLVPLADEATALLDRVRAQGAHVFDVAAVLKRAAPDDVSALFEDEVHFSVAGHQVVGRGLGELLITGLQPLDSSEGANDPAGAR